MKYAYLKVQNMECIDEGTDSFAATDILLKELSAKNVTAEEIVESAGCKEKVQ
jgi:hypothetical protein